METAGSQLPLAAPCRMSYSTTLATGPHLGGCSRPPDMDTVDTYRTIVYDILYGQGYIAQAMTEPVQKK